MNNTIKIKLLSVIGITLFLSLFAINSNANLNKNTELKADASEDVKIVDESQSTAKKTEEKKEDEEITTATEDEITTFEGDDESE